MVETENHRTHVKFVDRHAKSIGIFLALSKGILFATNGALVKVFSVNFVDAVIVRCVIQTLIAGSIMICLGLCKSSAILKKKDSEVSSANDSTTKSKFFLFAIISLQGLINASIIFTCYLAFLNMPIGDALAIVFSSPVFTLISTFMILGHRHSLWKVIFALVVIIGVVLIVQPPFLFGSNSENTNDGARLLGVIMAVTTATLGGFQSTILNYLNHLHSVILIFWTGVIGILECLVFAIFYHQDSLLFSGNYLNLSLEFIWQSLILALIGTIALFITTKAYQLLDPTICSVLGSQEVLLAFMIQAYFFKDPVGIWNILGGLLVLISGLCISSEPFFLKIYKTFRSNMMQSTGHITNSENFPKLENESGKEEDINEYARTSV